METKVEVDHFNVGVVDIFIKNIVKIANLHKDRTLIRNEL